MDPNKMAVEKNKDAAPKNQDDLIDHTQLPTGTANSRKRKAEDKPGKTCYDGRWWGGLGQH